MQVRLLEKMFQVVAYSLETDQEGLRFSGRNGENLIIPFRELRHFSVEGKGKTVKRFVLETSAGLYEGSFLNDGDAEKFIRILREQTGCYVDIRLDLE